MKRIKVLFDYGYDVPEGNDGINTEDKTLLALR